MSQRCNPMSHIILDIYLMMKDTISKVVPPRPECLRQSWLRGYVRALMLFGRSNPRPAGPCTSTLCLFVGCRSPTRLNNPPPNPPDPTHPAPVLKGERRETRGPAISRLDAAETRLRPGPTTCCAPVCAPPRARSAWCSAPGRRRCCSATWARPSPRWPRVRARTSERPR